MNKIFIILLLSFCNLISIISSSFAEENKVKIGLLVPLTGDNSEIGKQILKATRLALRDINSDIIEIFPKPTANSSYFDKYQVDYKIGSLPISFQIKRTRLTKIKKWYEKIVAIQNFWYDENKVTNGVLFLEFDPTRYEELFNQLKKLGINIILLNTRKSAVWNSKSISIVKKYNCKLINEHQILTNKKAEISKNLSHFESEFNKFWSDIDFLEKTFVFEQCVFWNVMKDSLIQVYKNRLEEFIKLILLSDEILKNSNFRCIVSLYTTGQNIVVDGGWTAW